MKDFIVKYCSLLLVIFFLLMPLRVRAKVLVLMFDIKVRLLGDS